MIVDIVDKYCTDDNNPIKNLRLKRHKPKTYSKEFFCLKEPILSRILRLKRTATKRSTKRKRHLT